MKKSIFILIPVVALFILQGCIPSLHPLYTKDKLVTLDALEGIWSNEPADVSVTMKSTTEGTKKEITVNGEDEYSERAEVWDFQKKDDGGHLLIHQDDDGEKAAFEVYVVKLNNELFLDFFPTDLPTENPGFFDKFDEENDLMIYHLLPVHTFAKLIISNNKMVIKMFDPEFLENLLEQRKIRIKHEALTDGGYLLTAQPDELQKFVEKYASDDKLYIEEDIELKRVVAE